VSPGPAAGPAPPAIATAGRDWPADEVAALAAGWAGRAAEHVAARPGPVAMVLPNTPEAVALFFALSTLERPLVLLPPEPRAWPAPPALLPGSALFLPPGLGALVPEAERRGLGALALAAGRPAAGGRPPAWLAGSGVVLFTSGSTGAPRPAFRPRARLLAAPAAIVQALGLPDGGAVLASLPLAAGHGLVHGLLLASLVGGSLVLAERFDPRAVLRLLARGRVAYWSGTPVMADLLARTPVAGVPAPPAASTVGGGPIPVPVFEAFRRRFGAPLRASYGTTEHGTVTVDAAPAALVRPGTVGRPLPGAAVRIGEDPRDPWPAGRPGPIWLVAPGAMAGYGIPPALEPPVVVEGWHATRDVGWVDGEGRLVLEGRADDCVKTRSGHLVSPAAVGGALRQDPAVTDLVVLAVGPARALGVLAEAPGGASPEGLRRRAAAALPAWARPGVVAVVPALPRLESGKPDRRACQALLERAAAGG
jgi:acyl-CoA synthetase (AMP-forming)/AMP-acid ligase II